MKGVGGARSHAKLRTGVGEREPYAFSSAGSQVLHRFSSRPARHCAIALFMLGILTAMTTSRASAQATRRIVGEVVAADSGEPIATAAVTLRDGLRMNSLRVTGSDGGFEFAVPSAGVYALQITRLGYMPRDTTIEVSNATVQVTVALSRDPVSIEPISVNVQGGLRSAGLVATGFYERMDQGWGAFFEPDWVGENKAGFAQLGSFTSALTDRASISCFPIAIPVYLDRRRVNYPTEGHYAMHELSAAQVAAAEVYPAAAPLPLWAFNDTTLTCGAVILWSTWTTDVPDDVTTVEVELCEVEERNGEVTLEGTVTDAVTGVPLPTARVRMRPAGDRIGTGPEPEVLADSIGRYRFCNVPIESEVVLTPSYGRYMGGNFPLTAASDQTVPLVVEVTIAASIAGRVVNELTGRGLRAAAVALVGTDYRTTSDGFGRFSFDQIPVGLYDVRVTCSGFEAARLSMEVLAAESPQRATVRLRPVQRTGRSDCTP